MFCWRIQLKFGSGNFALIGLVEAAAILYFRIQNKDLTFNQNAELLFLDKRYHMTHISLLHFVLNGAL